MTDIFALHGFTGSPKEFCLFQEDDNNGKDLLWKGIPYTDLVCAEDSFQSAYSKIASRLLSKSKQSTASKKILLGYSQGGRIALQFAIENPSNFDALILVASFYGYRTKEERHSRKKNDQKWLTILLQDGEKRFLEKWAQHPLIISQKNIPEPLKRKIQDYKKELSKEETTLSMDVLGAAEMPYLLPRLQDLSLPTLYLHGEKDEKYQKIGRDMKEVNQSIQVSSIPDAGHACHLENPVAFQSTLQSFIANF